MGKRPLRYRGAEPSQHVRRNFKISYALLLILVVLSAEVLIHDNVVLKILGGALLIGLALEVRKQLRRRF
jgi:hypothetical protein